MMSQRIRTPSTLARSACWAQCKGLLWSMGPVAMTDTHFFLAILLVPLMRLGGAQESCPTLCRCTLEILNCSRIASPPGFHRVPLPNLAAPPHPFLYLDFTGNAIASIGKEAWNSYSWAEFLVLKDNRLTRLQNSSLEGLLSLTYLDLSCNKIRIIESNAFEAVPFLQIVYLSGNVIEGITYGTFRAWHGMQFLRKVDLSHNPLKVIQDPYFYKLPSLKLLDLGATTVKPGILEDLLQTSLQLRILVLPKMMACCLCRLKEDIEVLCDTVKLECADSCDINATLCEEEGPLNRVREDILKALEIRKLNGSTLLNILPERAAPNSAMPKKTKHNHDTLERAPNDSGLAANFNLLKSVMQLTRAKADESLNVDWADKAELKKLYFLASLLQAALKETIVELEGDGPEAVAHDELPAHVSKEAAEDASLGNKRHVRKVMRGNWFGRKRRQKDIPFGLSRDGRQVAVTAMQSAVNPGDFEVHSEAGSWKRRAEVPDSQHALPFLRSHRAALPSSWKRSISDSSTNALMPRSAIVVDNNGQDRTSLLGDGFGAQILTKEALLNQLLHRSVPPAGDGKSQISAVDLEPSLNELLPDTTYWEHQRTSASPLPNLAPQDDYLLQGDFLEAELNEQLTSLIPNAPVRRLISHVIRILKMDCTAPALQMACAKLISRTGLLMKLFSENINETSSLWKPYFWPSKSLANMTASGSTKLEKPLGRLGSQGIPANGYGHKLLLAISVTAAILIVIAVISLCELWSHHSAAKGKTFLGKEKKPPPDEEIPRTPDLLMDKEPLWPNARHQSQDEIQKDNMADQFPDEESVEEAEITSWGDVRPSLPEPPLKKISSKTLSVATLELPPPPAAEPPPPPPPPPPPSAPPQKGSDTAEETQEDISSKAVSSGGDEGEDEEEEDSAEKSEAPTTEATSETGEAEGEEDEEDEDEESD